MSSPANRRLWPAFAVLYLVWGSTFLGIRVAVETLPPLTMAAARFTFAGAALLLVARRALPSATARQWRNAVLTGALFFLGNHGLVSTAARYIPSSLSSLIIAGEVPIIAVLSSLLLPDQPLTRRGLLGAAIGVGGVASLFVGQGLGSGAPQALPCLLVFGASVSWALGAVISQRLDLPRDPLLSAGMQMTCGAALLLVASVLRGEPAEWTSAALSARSLFALGYLILFGSVIAFACYTWLLRQTRAETVATHVFVNPLVAVALGAWLGGERLRPEHFVSGALILCSVCVITLGGRKRTPRPAAAAPVAGTAASESVA